MPKKGKRPSPYYDVGWGKPPKHTQFPPGVSGNPDGRPKVTKLTGIPKTRAAARAFLERVVNAKASDGSVRKMTNQDFLVERALVSGINKREFTKLLEMIEAAYADAIPEEKRSGGIDYEYLVRTRLDQMAENMGNPGDRAEELQRREHELLEREHELREREIKLQAAEARLRDKGVLD